MIGIYHGPKKTVSANEFFNYFFDEVLELGRDGLIITGKKFVLYLLFSVMMPPLLLLFSMLNTSLVTSHVYITALRGIPIKKIEKLKNE